MNQKTQSIPRCWEVSLEVPTAPEGHSLGHSLGKYVPDGVGLRLQVADVLTHYWHLFPRWLGQFGRLFISQQYLWALGDRIILNSLIVTATIYCDVVIIIPVLNKESEALA